MLTIEIKTDNAAFMANRKWELARVLRIISDGLETGATLGWVNARLGVDRLILRDVNGNQVGFAELYDEDFEVTDDEDNDFSFEVIDDNKDEGGK